HAVLDDAIKQRLPILLLYLFEPSIISTPESDTRHWRFAYQGVRNLQKRIGEHSILILHMEASEAFEKLRAAFNINAILSHQETGLGITYQRDRAIRQWCKKYAITWKTFERDGVRRNVPDRINWQEKWDEYMNAPQKTVDLTQATFVTTPSSYFTKRELEIPSHFIEPNNHFQEGGETHALALLTSFTQTRAHAYLKNLARPAYSRDTCSRLSPYLAHGHISARRVYQETKAAKPILGKNIDQFHNRLWWRCHYIQKLETEFEIEKEPINRGFNNLHKPDKEAYFQAWSTGNTGFPMIDASMRCLISTGYLNFRMRAMLATFWSFTLWQDWQKGATHLAKVFLDFEPGIHYPQFQMQAGMTGYHPLRIFNPIIQARKYDDYGVFIREWVPELQNVPDNFIATPWELSSLEQSFYNFSLGKDYPHPIVDYDIATKEAKEKYWSFRNSEQVRKHLPMLWKKHSLPKDIENYEKEFRLDPKLVTESIMYDPKTN
ncbi:MAG: FAD-binding domain-containing protein, partial [Bacteroidota bacterium]